MMADDWLLDDWDDEAFDDDVWDVTQLDLEPDDWYDEEADEEGEFGDPGPDGTEDYRSGTVSWNAWEVGTVFALGGWLADRHAEQVGEHVHEALQASRGAAAAAPRPHGAPHPPPSSGYPYGTATGTLTVGDALDQGALFADLAAADADGRDWLVQAEGRTAGGGLLLLVISVVPASAGPRLWVVAEEHAGGFSAPRLVPVFQPERQRGLAIFATDHAVEAADAAAWACAREGVAIDALIVTERR